METYKAGKITFVKYMTEEELVSFITDVHNFKLRTTSGETLTSTRTYVEPYQSGMSAANIKLNSLDCLDVLLTGEGYVRYTGYLGGGRNRELVYLFKHYGFEVEL